MTFQDYLNSVSDDKKEAFEKLRTIILNNLPLGFEETYIYSMIGYVVPLKTYPQGYHCNPKLPLSIFSIAAQKNFISLYHLGIYLNQELLDWFTNEYPKHSKSKLDMGKGCIRFKKINDIPFDLIGQLVAKISVDAWIKMYEEKLKK